VDRFDGLLKNSILFLFLGGAAVHRCDNWLVFGDGFRGCGKTHVSEKLTFSYQGIALAMP